MKTILFVSVLLSLNACVTLGSEKEYEAYLEAFVGKSKKVLIGKWGAPVRKFDVDDDGTQLIYVYIEDKGATWNRFTDTAENRSCKTEFTIVKNVVKSWSYDGYCD